MSKIYPYAGFWRRAVALLIDTFVISIPCSVVYIILMFSQLFRIGNSEALKTSPDAGAEAALTLVGTVFFFQVLVFVFFWLYFALQESGKAQATLGKRVMGIKVVGADGGRISFWHATGRLLGKMVSNMTLYFGYYMAGFTRKRQALHDLMAGTYVVQNSFQPGEEKTGLPFSTGGLIASILAAVLPVVLMGIIFFATIFMAVSGVNSLEHSQLKTTALLAKTQLLITAMNEDNGEPWPAEEDGVSYTKTSDGFRADFTDENGQKFTLRLKKGTYDACCAQGDCKAIDIEPCK